MLKEQTPIQDLNLKKIKVYQLYRLDPLRFSQYLRLKGILSAKSTFAKKKATPIVDLEYGQVREMIRNFEKPSYDGVLENFTFVFGVKERKYLRASVIDYFYAFNWIEKELRVIVENEARVLSREEDPILKLAGSDRLKIFGELPTLVDLGERFSIPIQEVQKWKYKLVFSIQAYDTVRSQVYKKYNELKPKNK